MKLPVNYRNIDGKTRRLVREEYIRRQDGKCMFCNHPLDQDPPKNITEKSIKWSLFPKGFLIHPVHLQHCHQTGLTEGAVHAYCNAVMWQYHGR